MRGKGSTFWDPRRIKKSDRLLQQGPGTFREKLLRYTEKAVGCSQGCETLQTVSLQVAAPTLHDHASLCWLCWKKEPFNQNQVAKWLKILAGFQYTLERWAGMCHRNVDELIWKTCENCQQCGFIAMRDGRSIHKELTKESQALLSRLKGSLTAVLGVARNRCKTARCMGWCIITTAAGKDSQLKLEWKTLATTQNLAVFSKYGRTKC